MPDTLFASKRGFLAVIVLSITAVIGPPNAKADGGTECIQRSVAFDGLTPLSYANVSAATGSKVYLHAQFPAQCAPNEECKGSAYLLSGDAVAIGKTCGAWSYVQYIGKKRVTTGWVSADRLKPANDSSVPSNREASGNGKRYQFELTSGSGVPVCEAYLQRLNQTQFSSPPYCGRPESSLVPGFVVLKRHRLDRAEFVAIFADAVNLIGNHPPQFGYVPRRNSNGSETLVPPPLGLPDGFVPSAWSYDPPINIENDGRPKNVVIWTDENHQIPTCGVPDGGSGLAERTGRWGIILSPDGRQVDRVESEVVFGRARLPPPGVPGYWPIGDEVSIFSYQGLTYFDTFLDPQLGDFEGHRVRDSSLSDILGVFLRRQGRTQQVCKYHFVEQGDQQ